MVFVIVSPETLDAGSKSVVQLLMTIDGATTITTGGVPTLPATRAFIVASRIAYARV